MQKPFELVVLGTSSATPTRERNPSGQYVRLDKHFFLIDCGEGTQSQINHYQLKLLKLKYVMISHLHGDHYFGLIGLISTLSLIKRKNKLKVFCPTSVLKIIQAHIKFSKMSLNYELDLISLNSQNEKNIYENPSFTIKTFPLKHSVYTNGFRIEEKKKRRKLLLDKALQYKIDKVYFNKLTKSENVFNSEGKEISYLEVTNEGPKPKSFAYCSDTAYFKELVNYITDVDLLYCETTFLEKDRDKALRTFHSTTIDAAKLAKKGRVKQLLIGHFSSRYDDYSMFFNEVFSIFENVIISEEGKKVQV